MALTPLLGPFLVSGGVYMITAIATRADMSAIDQVQLSFNSSSLLFINVMLAIVMFGVALDLRVADFARVLRAPRAPLIGLACQFVLMPAVATGLVMLIQPAPSMALGIILVSACPGGNVSNFLTSLARGNAAVSVSMSAISTVAAVFMTPFNFLFWGQLNPHTQELVRSIAITPMDILGTVVAILLLPTFAGMFMAARKPALAARLLRPMRIFSLLVLATFVAGALAANFNHFIAYIGAAFWIVLLVNAAGLLLGYNMARLGRVSRGDARAVCFETGIQNSGFGLVLVFQFFAGLGGMAIVVAWWGVWHLISGTALALVWARLSAAPAVETPLPD